MLVFLWRSSSQQLETDLKIEREWRQTLLNDLERERDTVAQLSTEALQINGLKKVKGRGSSHAHRVFDILFYFRTSLCACAAFAERDLICSDACLVFSSQEFHRLHDENVQLKTICEDQEQALEELGSKLSE